tara:strand:+ start:862 stop:2172 length:1311 start_codon:yes stop_codon:yes gene_type:complete
MPCTYCGSNKHTRAKCDKFEKDFKTYEKVSIFAREKYINTLLEKGINPGALVRTYNRTNNFMQKFSESKVVSLGNLDVFSHYAKIGRSIGSIYIESQELIELDDDNEKLVSVKHCYEVVEKSNSEWDTTGSWTQTQLLGFDEFKTMFKGKKRHPAFTGELFNCIVKELTTKKQTTAEVIAEMEAEEVQEARKTEKKEEDEKVATDWTTRMEKIRAAEPFKVGAKVTHNNDFGTEAEGTVYEISVEQGVGARIWLDPYRSGTPCSFEELTLVSVAVSTQEKLLNSLNKLEVPNNASIELIYEDGADVVHYNETQDETAMEETSVIDNLVDAARSGIKFEDDLIQTLRDWEMLDDYERDSYDFDNHCIEKIKENPYDFCDFIDFSTKQYDHKRGYTTLTATLNTTVEELRNASEGQVSSFRGWSAKFQTQNGQITLEI